MSGPTLFPGNPEEIEIDRLLLELGIELPEIENIAAEPPRVGASSEPASHSENVESPEQEEDSGIFLLLQPLTRKLPWSPEMEP